MDRKMRCKTGRKKSTAPPLDVGPQLCCEIDRKMHYKTSCKMHRRLMSAHSSAVK
jgi:hypothetical protein